MQIALRIVVVDPPAGVMFRVQRGRAALLEPARSEKGSIAFDFDVRVGDRDASAPRLLGEFAQGPPSARFVYVNSGTYAGQADSCWSRRAKVPLAGITWALIDEALRSPETILEAHIAGTGRDGGPACATVPLAREWRIAQR